MMLKVGAVLYGFLVQSVTPVPDVGGQMWRMVYEKNGAELVWLERADDVKTFAIAFRTLPSDDTGVAHILEHSVLSGSDKYPVKCPFAELRKSSPCVFLNAMTGLDMTCYPFSTRNDKDFLNLEDVYLDAVFHPTAVKSPLTFWQEGWHCEIDPKTGAPFYNGIVYNEMKGIRADPERVANREVLHYLFPDNAYGCDSGGNPSAIPGLTYESFCAFYRRHYHPSNARIFLDGNVDIASALAKLDAFLSPYERAAKVPPAPTQAPVSRSVTLPYPSTDDDGRKVILADAWEVGGNTNLVRLAAFEVLVDYLAGSNESPIKRALLSKGLCDDVYLYCGDYPQMPLVMVVRNTSTEKASPCRAVLRETVAQLLKDGLDRARLGALINRAEFSAREVDSSQPRGLVFASRALRPWLQGGDPASAFDLTGVFARLRAQMAEGLFEKCLREAFVDNPHHVELTFVPDGNVLEKGAKPVVGDLEALKRQTQQLAEFQKRDDSDIAKATMPTVQIADIPKKGSIVAHTIATNGTRALVTTKPTSDGIAYAAAYFPADGLNADELRMLPLLANLYGRLPTAKHDALALQTDVADKIGRLTTYTAATERGNFLVVELAALTNKSDEAVALAREILLETKFDDTNAVENVLRQMCLAAERGVASRGDHLAERYASRDFSRRATSRDILSGYAQLRFLQSTGRAVSPLTAALSALASRVIVRDGMILSLTDNLPKTAQDALCDFPHSADGAPPQPASLALEPPTLAGLQIDGDAGYSSTVAPLPPDAPYEGAMRVAANILSCGYLFKQIRQVGGAYGTGLDIHPSGLIACFTFRDPTPVDSLSVIRRSGEALSAFVRSTEPLDQYIVATVAKMDPYRSPSAEALRPVELYLMKRTPADVERERAQVLATSRADLERVAEMLKRELPASRSFVVGGAKQVKALPGAEVNPLR